MPVSIAPATTAIYADLTARPGAEQRSALDRLLRIVADDPRYREVFGSYLDRMLAAQKAGFSFRKDVEPMLGDHVALMIGPTSEVTVAAGVRDRERAEKTVGRLETGPERKYRGASSRSTKGGGQIGFVRGFVVFATNRHAFERIVDASRGTSLSEMARYQEAERRAAGRRFGFVYLDPQRFLAIARGTSTSPIGEAIRQRFREEPPSPLTVTLTAMHRGLAIELATRALKHSREPKRLFSAVPSRAFGAAMTADLGDEIRARTRGLRGGNVGRSRTVEAVHQRTGIDAVRDVMPWAGEAVLFPAATAGGEFEQASYAGAVFIRSKNRALSSRAARRIAASLRRHFRLRDVPVTKVAAGRPLTRLRDPVQIVLRGSLVEIAFGRRVRRILGDGTRFTATPWGRRLLHPLAPGFRTWAALDSQSLLTMLQELSVLHEYDPLYMQLSPYLDGFRDVILATKREGSTLRSRLFVGIDDRAQY